MKQKLDLVKYHRLINPMIMLVISEINIIVSVLSENQTILRKVDHYQTTLGTKAEKSDQSNTPALTSPPARDQR